MTIPNKIVGILKTKTGAPGYTYTIAIHDEELHLQAMKKIIAGKSREEYVIIETFDPVSNTKLEGTVEGIVTIENVKLYLKDDVPAISFVEKCYSLVGYGTESQKMAYEKTFKDIKLLTSDIVVGILNILYDSYNN